MIGRTLSHFRILSKIGEGGMGVVYRAEDTKLRRQVALKVLPPDLVANEERRLRFLREARAAAAVTHPNIGTIYEVDEADGIVFIAMELVEGKTLREAIGGRPMPIKDALRIATEMAEGLARAHQAKVIHRDLKPDNVIVGTDGHAKILDFGLAKLLEERSGSTDAAASKIATISGEMTREGKIFGTAAYMSPEQARGQQVDTRSDIFSFGTTLYEMVTGRVPFQGKTNTDILSAIVRDEPTPPSRLNPGVPYELERITSKCLEKDPGERYQHTDDLAVDLRKLKRVTDSGVQALTGQDAARPRQRRWLLPLAAMAGLVIVLAGVGFFLSSREGSGSLPEVTQKQLTANPVSMNVYDAAISPDGKYLAYTDPTGLHLQLIQTGETHPLSLPGGIKARWLAWFPDSTRLLLTGSDRTREGPFANPSLWSTSILGGAPRKLHEDAWRASVSPDGTQIIFLSVKRGWPPREIWIMGPGGEQAHRLFEAGKGDNFWWVGWSPDGRRIVYGKYHYDPNDTVMSIEARDRDGENPLTLVSDPRLFMSWHGILRGCWLPDGRLVYARAEPAPKDGDSNLWELSLELQTGKPLGQPQRLTNWAGYSVQELSVTADGKRLAFLKHRQQPDVYVGEFEENAWRLKSTSRLTLDERDDYPDAWMPDSKSVLFRSNRRGSSDVFRKMVGAQTAEAVVAGPEDEYGATLSPDGSSILYWSAQRGDSSSPRGSLMRVPVSGGSAQRILDGSDIEGYGCPSEASAPCVLSRLEGTRLVFSTFDLHSGQEQAMASVEIDRSAFYNWALSPDGSQVAVVNFDNRVRILTLKEGEVRELSAGNWHGMEFAAWTADGQGVIVTGGGIMLINGLLYMGLDGHTELVWQKENEWPVYPVPSPDGRYLAYATMIADSNAWMIENF